MLVAWAGLAVKDRMKHRHRYANRPFFKKKHEASCNNFALRFFYEFFLEISICVLINITVTDFSTFSSTSQWLISFVALIVIIGTCCWLVSLFCKNGPFLKGFYDKGTYLESFWEARPFDTTFNATSSLII